MGADVLVDSSEVDLKRDWTGSRKGAGPTWSSRHARFPQMQALALEIAGCHGRVSLFGGMPKGRENVTLNTNLIHYKELSVTATTGSSIQDFHSALRILSSGRDQGGGPVTARFSLEEMPPPLTTRPGAAGLKAVVMPAPSAAARIAAHEVA